MKKILTLLLLVSACFCLRAETFVVTSQSDNYTYGNFRTLLREASIYGASKDTIVFAENIDTVYISYTYIDEQIRGNILVNGEKADGSYVVFSFQSTFYMHLYGDHNIEFRNIVFTNKEQSQHLHNFYLASNNLEINTGAAMSADFSNLGKLTIDNCTFNYKQPINYSMGGALICFGDRNVVKNSRFTFTDIYSFANWNPGVQPTGNMLYMQGGVLHNCDFHGGIVMQGENIQLKGGIAYCDVEEISNCKFNSMIVDIYSPANASNYSPQMSIQGGVLYAQNADIINCEFKDNSVGSYLDDFYNNGENCMAARGGVVYAKNCIVSGCYVNDNEVDMELADSRNTENYTTIQGGGLYMENGVVKQSYIQNNTLKAKRFSLGGGVFLNDADMQTCLITNNQAINMGYGMGNGYLTYDEDGFIGGGIYGTSGSEIEFSTIVRNFSINQNNISNGQYNRGGGIGSVINTNLTVKGCVIWQNSYRQGEMPNTTNEIFPIPINTTYTAAVVYGEYLPPSKGNISLSFINEGSLSGISFPCFVDPDNGNFQLSGESDCLNRLTSNIVFARDILGVSRLGIMCDMGCYESSATFAGAVKISGTLMYGEELSATVTTSNGTGTLYYQWKRNGTPINGATSSNYILTEDDVYSLISVDVRCSNKSGNINGEALEIIKKAFQVTAPNAPVLDTKSYNSVTLVEKAGCEYAIEGGAWQASCEFLGLRSNTQYNFLQRYAENSTHKASPISTSLIVTTDNVPITPDENGIVYIKEDGIGNGSSWENAASSVARALQENGVQQIWVAVGTYYPTDDDNRERPFIIPNNMKLYGGFAGTETSIDQRDIESNETILSGDVNPDNDEDAFCVVYIEHGADENTIIDGFTVRDGNTKNAYDQYMEEIYGVGIANYGGLVQNCKVTNNIAYCNTFNPDASFLYIEGVGINNNGGIVRNCEISDNDVKIDYDSEDYYTNNIGAEIQVAGIGISSKQNGFVEGCFIMSNMISGSAYALSGKMFLLYVFGGGIYAVNSTVSHSIVKATFVTGSIYSNNVGTSKMEVKGAGINSYNSLVSNCIFNQNLGNAYVNGTNTTAKSYGGALYARNNSTIVNCTMATNWTGATGETNDEKGENVYIENSTLQNSIVWSPALLKGNQLYTNGGIIEHTAVRDSLFSGIGNMLLSPDLTGENPDSNYVAFVNISGGDYLDLSLQPESACIDAGNNAYVSVAGDLNDSTRIQGPAVDMGCYESYVVPTVPTNVSIENQVIDVIGCYGATQTIVVAEDGNEVRFQNASNTNLIAGQSIRFLPGTVIEPGAYVHAWITTNETFCDGLPESIVRVKKPETKSLEIVPEKEDELELKTLKVYPNPSDGRFTIEIRGAEGSNDVVVYNNMGQLVEELKIWDKGEIEMFDVQKGIYLVKLKNSNIFQRIVIR